MALFLLITSFKKVLLLTITIALFASSSSTSVLGALVDATANATTSTTPLSSCVTNNAQLRNAVKLAQTDPAKKRTKITLCATPIQISNAIDPVTGSTGINLSNRYIDLDCKLASATDTTCILEGKYKTRLFFGSNVNLTVHNVGFADASPAYTDTMNGAPDSEDIYISYNHADKYGGAIALYNSKFVTSNKVMIARNSAAYSGAIELYNTSATIRDVRFDTNSATPGSNGAMNIEKSTVTMARIDVIANEAFQFSSAFQVTESSVKMNEVSFRRNNSTDGSVVSIVKSNATITSCEFYKNTADTSALFVRMSKVTLNDTVFIDNDGDQFGTQLYISDDKSPKHGGSFVDCRGYNLFCDGLDKFSIYDSGRISNTNCRTKGTAGKPGITC